jgi:multidrug/hemolysin transport system ATP-binding protein
VEQIVKIENLLKRFGGVTAVNGVSFNVGRGSLFAFLGTNGAGKSTTINILCQILKKDGGRVLIDGLDIDSDSRRVKERVGVVFQNSVLDNELTVLENLRSRAAFYKKDTVRDLTEIIDGFNLGDVLNGRFSRLSGGQRRRVDIARAMLSSPKLLFLDEPTTGLDPAARRAVWDILGRLKSRGLTVFLTTHYMEETARADEVVIIDGGSVAASGTPDGLKSLYASDSARIIAPRTPKTDKILADSGIEFTYAENAYTALFPSVRAALDFLHARKEFADFEIVKGGMDDVFLRVTKKQGNRNA